VNDHFLQKITQMNRSASITAVIIVLFFCHPAAAQPIFSRYELGLGAGVTLYQGDLTKWRLGSYETMRPGVQVSAAKIISRTLSVRANLLRTGVKGDEAKYNSPDYRKQRSFNFHSPVTELSLQLVLNPLGKNYNAKGFSPYLFTGAGISFLNIKRDHSGFNAAYFGDGSDLPQRIALDDQHQVPRAIPVVPVGGGVRYNLSDRLAVNAEFAYRLTATDYLDGFSQAANPKRNDHYNTTTAGLIYRTGTKSTTACPVLRY
jgi:opacity protein-like surface antigen